MGGGPGQIHETVRFGGRDGWSWPQDFLLLPVARRTRGEENLRARKASGGPAWKWPGAGDKMLHVGQVLYDNDPRYRGRTVEVIRVEERCLVCKCGPREVIIRRDRVHSDGERRRSGYSIVPPTPIVVAAAISGA